MVVTVTSQRPLYVLSLSLRLSLTRLPLCCFLSFSVSCSLIHHEDIHVTLQLYIVGAVNCVCVCILQSGNEEMHKDKHPEHLPFPSMHSGDVTKSQSPPKKHDVTGTNLISQQGQSSQRALPGDKEVLTDRKCPNVSWLHFRGKLIEICWSILKQVFFWV